MKGIGRGLPGLGRGIELTGVWELGRDEVMVSGPVELEK